MKDQENLRLAYEQALKSYQEGGLPIGSVMVDAHGVVVGVGHNKRVQEHNPILHGEMDCMRNAGPRKNYKGFTLYTTLSPCMMCSGTIVQFGIKRVVVGEDENFKGNIDFLQQNGVEVVLLNDADCTALMKKFQQEKPELWLEDIGEGA
ncbi:MAG: nucleoside deaminase [Rhodospirillales bacterium]|nr:nucleoside deaminase [Rhodospirillales bacterium]